MSSDEASSSEADKDQFPALGFRVESRWNRARASTLELPHGAARAPMFMPVGTQASVKGLTSRQLEETVDAQVILGNTYHLGLRPGGDVVAKLGGIHEFMSWPRGLLTDSGGFQMVSLVKFSEVTEEGVRFQSPVDGSETMLTPEHSIALQNDIGADIIMQLDDVVSSQVKGPRVDEAMWRTLRWLDRCVDAHARPTEQNLFGIVQGGLDEQMRRTCAREMVKRSLPGYAVGGLSGGEDKNLFWRMVMASIEELPDDRPRYCMGVGYPEDLVVCVALGADMFDCVFPARTARFGTALVPSGFLKLRQSSMATDCTPIDPLCKCYVCLNYTRAYLHALPPREGQVSAQLITLHNVAYLVNLMKRAREAILRGNFPDFVRDFMLDLYPDKKYPDWSRDALEAAGEVILRVRSPGVVRGFMLDPDPDKKKVPD